MLHAANETPRDHPNASRIRELFAAFRERDLAKIQAAIPEHAVWHFLAARARSQAATSAGTRSSLSSARWSRSRRARSSSSSKA